MRVRKSLRIRRPSVTCHIHELELPFQINGGQYAPVAWSEIAGWSEDDHLAAYKAFRVSCRPISAQRTPPADPKALGTSLRDPCRIARGLELSDGAEGKSFLRGAFSPLAHFAAWRRRGLCHRLLRAHRRRLADGERGLQGAGLSPAVQSVRPRHHAELGRLAQQGPGVPQDRPPQAGALLRSRRDRGWRDCRPRPRNLLAEGTDRPAVLADPGFGAGQPRRRLDRSHQLRRA